MKTYWISRNGAPAEGPYSLDQLSYMWQTGQITPLDIAAEDGTDEWFNVAFLMVPAALEPIKARRRRQRANPTGAALVAICGLIMLAFYWPVGIGLIVISCLMERITWNCGHCGTRVEETSKVCPSCTAHLKFEWYPENPAVVPTAGAMKDAAPAS